MQKIIFKNEPARNLHTRILDASYNKDPLIENTTNGWVYYIRYDWNDGKNNRFVVVVYSTNDFYNTPKIVATDWDDIGKPNIFKTDVNASQSIVFENILTVVKGFLAGDPHRYDDYLEITKMWDFKCNEIYWGNYEDRGYTTSDVKGYDYCSKIFFSIREKLSSEWRNIGSIDITYNYTGSGDGLFPVKGEITASPFMGHTFKKRYLVKDDVIKEIIPVIKATYKNPVNDITKEPVVKTEDDLFAETKAGLLMQRLVNTGNYKFTAGDTLGGIWSDDRGNIFIFDRLNKKDYIIAKDFLKAGRAYQQFVGEHFFERKGNELIASAFVQSQQKILPTLKYHIKEIKRNQIIFDDGKSWKRSE